MNGVNAGLVMGLAGALGGVLMALLALSISRAPGWRELRSFALVASTAAAYCFFDLVHVLPVSRRTLELGEGLGVGACFAYGLAWIRHLAVVDGKRIGRLMHAAAIAAVIVVVLAFVPGALINGPVRLVEADWLGITYTMATATPLAVGGVAIILVGLLVSTFRGRRRWRDGWVARLPMIGAGVLVATGISDTLAYMQVTGMPQLMAAITVLVVGAMGVSYARRFIADAGRLEELSTRLEHEVASRTAELMESQGVAAQHERLAGLGRIAAGVAHEINNPLTVIQQNLDRMRALLEEHAALTTELRSRFDKSRGATQRIAEIVRQLLATGRPSTSDHTDVMAFAVVPVVERAIAAASATAPDLRVSVAIADTICVRGNPGLLEQVLINLLVNAAHAAKDVRDGAHARIEGVRQGDRVRIGVIDNGTGIADAVRDRIFEPFSTTKPIGEGTGLGLAVSRGLMTRQGGTLVVATTTAAGTEMALELPAADAPELVATPEEPANLEPAATRDLRVLVIDDNEDLREVLSLQLGSFFLVEAAETVDEALAMVSRGGHYDAVVCDLMMPAGGAERWLARCVSLDPRLGARTILLTGGPTTDEAIELVADHREQVLFKPPAMTELRPMIERVARQ